MTNPKLADELTALAEKASKPYMSIPGDPSWLIERDARDNAKEALGPWLLRYAPTIIAALTARSDGWRDIISAAYHAGADDVHTAWINGKGQGESDFGEAASDYADHAIRNLTPPETTP